MANNTNATWRPTKGREIQDITDKINALTDGNTTIIRNISSGFTGINQIIQNIITITKSTTVTTSSTINSLAQVILCDTTTGNITITLPSASANLDVEFLICKTTTDANTVIISGTISGISNFTLIYYLQWLKIKSDGTNWIVTNGLNRTESSIKTITSNYTVIISDTILLCDCTIGNIAITLPSVSNVKDMEYSFIKIDTSANIITITGTISGIVNPIILWKNQNIRIKSDGTNWNKIDSLNDIQYYTLAATPNSVVTPNFIGQLCLTYYNSIYLWWKAIGLSNTDWTFIPSSVNNDIYLIPFSSGKVLVLNQGSAKTDNKYISVEHDGTDGIIKSLTGMLKKVATKLRFVLVSDNTKTVDIYHDGTNAIFDTSAGIIKTNDKDFGVGTAGFVGNNIKDSTDTTKILNLIFNIATATTHTLTVPNADVNLTYLTQDVSTTASPTFANIYKTIGSKDFMKSGANASAGLGTLVGGTLTINTTAITGSSLIFVTDTGGGTNIGSLYVSNKVVNVSFTISSTNILDTSSFNWFIIDIY